jgi:hypothetical protein
MRHSASDAVIGAASPSFREIAVLLIPSRPVFFALQMLHAFHGPP